MFPSLLSKLTSSATLIAAGAASVAEQYNLASRSEEAVRFAKSAATGLYTRATETAETVAERVLPLRKINIEGEPQKEHFVSELKAGSMFEEGDDWEVEEEFEYVEGMRSFERRVRRERGEVDEGEQEAVGSKKKAETEREGCERGEVSLESVRGQRRTSPGRCKRSWEKLPLPALKEDIQLAKRKRRATRVDNAVLDNLGARFKPTMATVAPRRWTVPMADQEAREVRPKPKVTHSEKQVILRDEEKEAALERIDETLSRLSRGRERRLDRRYPTTVEEQAVVVEQMRREERERPRGPGEDEGGIVSPSRLRGKYP